MTEREIGKNVHVRLWMSVLLVLGLVWGAQLITVNAFSIRTAEAPFPRLLDFLSGGICTRGSIFAMGATHIILAWAVTIAMANLGLISRRRLDDEGSVYDEGWLAYLIPNRRMRYWIRGHSPRIVIEVLLAFVCALALSLYVTTQHNAPLLSWARIGALEFFFMGGIILTTVIQIIDALDTIDGALGILAIGCVISVAKSVTDLVLPALEGVIAARVVFFIGASIACAIAASIFLTRTIKIPTISVKAKSEVLLPLPTAPFGTWSLRAIDTAFLFLCAIIVDWLITVSNHWHGYVGKTAVGVGCVTVIALFGIRRKFSRQYAIQSLLQNMRAHESYIAISGVRPGKQTEDYMQEKTSLANNIDICFFFYGFLSMAIADQVWHLAIHPLLLVCIWAPVEFLNDAITKISVECAIAQYQLEPRGRGKLRGRKTWD